MDSDFRAIEFLESGVVEWLRADGAGAELREKLAGREAQEFLSGRIVALPQVRRMFVVDATGKVAASSSAWPAETVSVETRDYFKALRDDPERETVISGALPSLVDGRWTIFVARPIRVADGGFLGAVVAGVELAYFEDAFSRLEIGLRSSVTLYRRDAMMLARHPRLEDRIGAIVQENDALHRALGPSGSGAVRRISPLDGVERMLGARVMRDHPLYLVAAQSGR